MLALIIHMKGVIIQFRRIQEDAATNFENVIRNVTVYTLRNWCFQTLDTPI